MNIITEKKKKGKRLFLFPYNCLIHSISSSLFYDRLSSSSTLWKEIIFTRNKSERMAHLFTKDVSISQLYFIKLFSQEFAPLGFLDFLLRVKTNQPGIAYANNIIKKWLQSCCLSRRIILNLKINCFQYLHPDNNKGQIKRTFLKN